MYNRQLFRNREEAIRTGKILKSSGNQLVLTKASNQLIRIINDKLNIIQNNIALYEAFIESYQKEEKSNESN